MVQNNDNTFLLRFGSASNGFCPGKRPKKDEKVMFILQALNPQANFQLQCREFSISAKTIYKWMERFGLGRLSGLAMLLVVMVASGVAQEGPNLEGFPPGVNWDNATPEEIYNLVFSNAKANKEETLAIVQTAIQKLRESNRFPMDGASGGKQVVEDNNQLQTLEDMTAMVAEAATRAWPDLAPDIAAVAAREVPTAAVKVVEAVTKESPMLAEKVVEAVKQEVPSVDPEVIQQAAEKGKETAGDTPDGTRGPIPSGASGGGGGGGNTSSN